MGKQVLWTKYVMEHFLETANLTERQEHIMRMRWGEKSNTEIAMALNISPATLHREILKIKAKYDAVQQYDPILPKRKKSEKELYMDTH